MSIGKQNIQFVFKKIKFHTEHSQSVHLIWVVSHSIHCICLANQRLYILFRLRPSAASEALHWALAARRRTVMAVSSHRIDTTKSSQ